MNFELMSFVYPEFRFNHHVLIFFTFIVTFLYKNNQNANFKISSLLKFLKFKINLSF